VRKKRSVNKMGLIEKYQEKEVSSKVCERRKKNFKGFIITRMLKDDNGKVKPFTYYPSKKCGKPPFLFKNKNQAIKKMKSKSMDFYRYGDDLKVVKFKPNMYLDRF